MMIDSDFDGLLLLDKPAGITSMGALRVLKRRFRIKRVGHAGTLDPMATGLLMVLCGRATKLQSLVLEYFKEYLGCIRFGVGTKSGDITGDVVATDSRDRVREVLEGVQLSKQLSREFHGEILQQPPSVSAIRVGGRRSYELAREGHAVELDKRSVKIDHISFEELPPDSVRCKLRCSSGTYVRSIAVDAGAMFGLPGTLCSLRRTEIGPFKVSQAKTLEACWPAHQRNEAVIDFSQLSDFFPSFGLSAKDCSLLLSGRQEVLRQLGKPTQGLSRALIFNPSGLPVSLVQCGAGGVWALERNL